MTAAVETMAYVGATPWHGIGNTLTDNATIDEWKRQAGMEWEAEMVPVHFPIGDKMYYMEDRNVLYRNDNGIPLGVVGSKYHPVQPGEVLEFFRDITELGHFKMDTAGVLFSGKRLWALARHNKEAVLDRKNNDIVRPYLLLATSMDGTLATVASFTTVRVVCNNTLQMALHGGEDKVRVTHRSQFNERMVKQELGLIDERWGLFEETMVRMTKRKVTPAEVEHYFGRVFAGDKFEHMDHDEQSEYLDSRQLQRALNTYSGFIGQDTAAARGTLWGALNGITAYVDHAKQARTVDSRLSNAWFGTGKRLKQTALEEAVAML